MGLFDNLKKTVSAPKESAKPQTGSVTITIQALPESLAEMKALPEASLDSPFKTAALTVCALCAYAADAKVGSEMIEWLNGPKEFTNYERSFLNDRFMDGKYYIPFSYFAGAVPANDYTPDAPYSITIEAGPYAYDQEGYATLYLTSGGADSKRPITLRKKESTGEWFVDNYSGVVVGIRTPKSQDPWA